MPTGRSESVAVGVARTTCRAYVDVGHFVWRYSRKIRRLLFRRSQAVRFDGNFRECSFRLKRRLYRLEIVNSTIPLSFLQNIVSKINLRELVLRDVRISEGEGTLEFLKNLKRLKVLVVDRCPDLVASGYLTLSDLSNLKHLTLKVDWSHFDLTGLQAITCGGAVFRLTLRGQPPWQNLNALEWMVIGRKLEALTFESFGQSEFPWWACQMGNLRFLQFERGSLYGQGMTNAILAPSFSVLLLNCQIENALRQILQTKMAIAEITSPELL